MAPTPTSRGRVVHTRARRSLGRRRFRSSPCLGELRDPHVAFDGLDLRGGPLAGVAPGELGVADGPPAFEALRLRPLGRGDLVAAPVARPMTAASARARRSLTSALARPSLSSCPSASGPRTAGRPGGAPVLDLRIDVLVGAGRACARS